MLRKHYFFYTECLDCVNNHEFFFKNTISVFEAELLKIISIKYHAAKIFCFL